MSKTTRPCRVCEKIFIPCVDCASDNSSFHWREVACSLECGTEYLRQVLNEREVKPIKTIENEPITEEILSVSKVVSKSKKNK